MPTRKERELAIDLADWHRTKRCSKYFISPITFLILICTFSTLDLTGLSQHIDNMRMAVTKDVKRAIPDGNYQECPSCKLYYSSSSSSSPSQSSSRTSPPSLSHFESHKSFCSDKEPRCFEPALRLVKYHLEYFPRFSLRYTAYGPNDDKLDSAIKKEKEIAIRQAALLKLTKGKIKN